MVIRFTRGFGLLLYRLPPAPLVPLSIPSLGSSRSPLIPFEDHLVLVSAVLEVFLLSVVDDFRTFSYRLQCSIVNGVICF